MIQEIAMDATGPRRLETNARWRVGLIWGGVMVPGSALSLAQIR